MSKSLERILRKAFGSVFRTDICVYRRDFWLKFFEEFHIFLSIPDSERQFNVTFGKNALDRSVRSAFNKSREALCKKKQILTPYKFVSCFWIWAKSFWQIFKTTFYSSNVRFWWNSCFLVETPSLNVVGLWAKSFQQICQKCINCPEERFFYLFGKFILLLSLSRFGRTIFGTFTNQNGRVVKIAVFVFSGICWGKSSLVENVNKSSSVLDSEQIKTRQVCEKKYFGCP